MSKVFYVSKQDIRTIFDAIDVLEKISTELEGMDTDLTVDLDMSLFYLRSFLKEFRKYVKPIGVTFEQYRENMSMTRPAQPGGDDSSAGRDKKEVI
jgi:hypothetical protein